MNFIYKLQRKRTPEASAIYAVIIITKMHINKYISTYCYEIMLCTL